MERPRILIVEDTMELARVLRRGLEEEGFEVGEAHTGTEAFRRLQETWDVVILDLMLPDASGESILKHVVLRPECPRVLVLTARSRIEDKLSLFRQGCDDYLTKPFVFDELLMRVRALLRRAPKALPENVEYEDLSLDPETHTLSVGGHTVTLTPKESAICRRLMSEPGQIVSRAELLRSVWGLNRAQRTNFVEVHLANLRKKLAELDCEEWLQTVRASGIALRKPEAHGA